MALKKNASKSLVVLYIIVAILTGGASLILWTLPVELIRLSQRR